MDEHNAHQPKMSIVSPICGPVSQLRESKLSKVNPQDVHEKSKDGFEHFKFAVALRKFQSERGRFLLFEHPSTAKSWSTLVVEEIVGLPGC